MLGVGARRIWVGEKGIIEYVVPNLGWQFGEERGGDLGIDVWSAGDLGNGSGL